MKHEDLIKKAHSVAKEGFKKLKDDHRRLAFHLDPPSNWMNDPNGLVFFNNEYHVFFQYDPYTATGGSKHWGHFKSSNLLDWVLLPPAIAPMNDYDQDGCWSGSGVDHNGVLTLIYTGHVDNKSPKQVQCLAVSEDGIHFTKHEANPVVPGPPEGFSEDFRDPKVWKHEDTWYMVIGNNENGKGHALLYSSAELVNWKFEGIMAESVGDQGFMWECPDVVGFNKEHILILSPEGMDGVKHKSVYLTGDMNYDTKRFEQNGCYPLDYGTDFYAPQTFKDGDGRNILFGWMNLWESKMPTKEKGWVGSLTIPRVLKLNHEGVLLQQPAEELAALRKNELRRTVTDKDVLVRDDFEFGEMSAEFKWEDDQNVQEIWLRVSKDRSEKTIIGVDPTKNILYVDSTVSGEGDDSRIEMPIEPVASGNSYSVTIFVDRSSIEIFAEDGKKTLTTRIYPKQTSQNLIVTGSEHSPLTLTVWDLEDRMKNMIIHE